MGDGTERDRPAGRRWLALVGVGLCGLVAAVAVGAGAVGTDGETTGTPATGSATAAAGGTPTATGGASSTPTPSPSPSRASTPFVTKVVTKGNGRVVPVRYRTADTARTGRVVRWSVEAEQGLGIDLQHFAEVVRETLHDARGWEAEDRVHFVQVPAWQVEAGAAVDVRVTLASPSTTDRLCRPFDTAGQVSCSWGDRAVINSRRWVNGAGSYRGRLADYRTYVVNHEVGHSLGHAHEPCPAKGRRAPVMVQQTLTLGGCTAWPYPRGDGSRRR